jgi:hypothetical protein
MPCDNLFQKVDKHFVHLIENKPHPPIIALIMRRSSGIQVLECHVFICRSTGEAQAIVNEIKSACNKHKQEMSQKTQIFQYKPYSSESGSVSSTTSQNIHLQQQQQQQQKLHQSSQPVELPLRIQDRVETKTTLTSYNDGTNYSLPPKSPFFKAGKQFSVKGAAAPPAHMTTEKVYETSYIDGTNTTNMTNKSACVIQTNGANNSRNATVTNKTGSDIAKNLSTKSSSHISSKGPASASSASLFSKLKSNLRDRSLSKSNTNLSSSGGVEHQPQQPQIFLRQQGSGSDQAAAAAANSGASASKNQRKNTFKQLKLKKGFEAGAAGPGKESLPLSSTSSITFGSNINETVGKSKARPLSSLSNNDCDSHDDSPSPIFTKKIDKTNMKLQSHQQQQQQQQHLQQRSQQFQQSKLHPQSILVNGCRKESNASAAVNVFCDDDSVSIKSDSYAITTQQQKVVVDSKKEQKKPKLGKRLLETARSTLRSHSAHSFKNSFKNLVSKSEAMIHHGGAAGSSNLGGSHANLSTAGQVKSTSKSKQTRNKFSIMDSNLLIDSNNIFDPVSVVYHHQIHPQQQQQRQQQPMYSVGNLRQVYAQAAAGNHRDRVCGNGFVATPKSGPQQQAAFNPKGTYNMPYARSNSTTQLVTCHKCAQPCSVQYVRQPPVMPPPPLTTNAVYCSHTPAASVTPPPCQQAPQQPQPHNYQNIQQAQQQQQQQSQKQQVVKVGF